MIMIRKNTVTKKNFKGLNKKHFREKKMYKTTMQELLVDKHNLRFYTTDLQKMPRDQL